MSRPEAMIRLASEASNIEQQPADAAVLLVDAAAMCAVECGMDLCELSSRLSISFEMLQATAQSIATHGTAASVKAQ